MVATQYHAAIAQLGADQVSSDGQRSDLISGNGELVHPQLDVLVPDAMCDAFQPPAVCEVADGYVTVKHLPSRLRRDLRVAEYREAGDVQQPCARYLLSLDAHSESIAGLADDSALGLHVHGQGIVSRRSHSSDVVGLDHVVAAIEKSDFVG